MGCTWSGFNSSPAAEDAETSGSELGGFGVEVAPDVPGVVRMNRTARTTPPVTSRTAQITAAPIQTERRLLRLLSGPEAVVAPESRCDNSVGGAAKTGAAASIFA